MSKAFIILTALVMFFARNNSDINKVTGNAQAAEQHTDTAQNKPGRQILIEELKKLKQTIASNNKEKIADIFEFPISDTAFGIYVDDSIYNEQFRSNGNKT